MGAAFSERDAPDKKREQSRNGGKRDELEEPEEGAPSLRLPGPGCRLFAFGGSGGLGRRYASSLTACQLSPPSAER